MKDILRSVIVDDVDSMRAVLKKLLQNFDRIQVIGEASSFDGAVETITEEKPDLLFLDIDLGGLTSIDILSKLDYKPMVIFITSHSDFAIRAFELNAVDYILKPISLDRLTKAIEKVTNKWVEDTGKADMKTAFSDDDNSRFTSDHIILLSIENKMFFVGVRDIVYIEAYGNYTKIFLTDGRMSITYNSIKNWVTRLPEELFIQIHRSTIVNLNHVARIEKWANDTGRLFLKNTEKPFEISRSHFFELKKKYKM